MFCSSIGCKVDLDTGDVMTQMINTSSRTLEDELKTYKYRAKSKTQEVEARARRREQSCSRSSETKRCIKLELSNDFGSTQIDMTPAQSCRALH
jgi:hypothetical protein